MSADTIRRQLQSLCLTPNRALGQNFLADDGAARAIAEAACLPDLPALEIGPGLGALTEKLLACAARVTAVELDEAMVGALQSEFMSDVRLALVHADFLKFNLEGYARDEGAYCAAGNLPYYVTTPICMKLLSCSILPARMALMVQKEAAARFTARIGTKLYGPLSVLSQLYYAYETLMTLSPAQFYPQPEVDSAVLVFVRKENVPPVASLPKLLEAAFAMRRKTLANNLRAARFDREEVAALLASLGIPENARAEQVEPALFARLARSVGL